MHLLIAKLIKFTLYSKLQNYLLIFMYLKVDKMRKRLFWLDYNKRKDAFLSNIVQLSFKTNP